MPPGSYSELANWDGSRSNWLKHRNSSHHHNSLSSSSHQVASGLTVPDDLPASEALKITLENSIPPSADHCSSPIHNLSIPNNSKTIKKPNTSWSNQVSTSSKPIVLVPSTHVMSSLRDRELPFNPVSSGVTSKPASGPFAAKPQHGKNLVIGTTAEEIRQNIPSNGDKVALLTSLSETSSRDAEGEDETDEMCVDLILLPQNMNSSPLLPRSPVSPSASLYTPSEPYTCSSISDLPVPVTSRRLRKRRVSRKAKFKFSHVAVPPFPPGLGHRDYKPAHSSSLARKKTSKPQVQVHTSISDALSAALQHNANTGARFKSTQSSALDSGSLKRKRPYNATKKPTTRDEEVRPNTTKKPKIISDRPVTPTSTVQSLSAPVSLTAPQSMFLILLHNVDPWDPPPTSYAALVSSTRHLISYDHVPLPDSASAQVMHQPWFEQWGPLFPSREPSSVSDDDITLGFRVPEPNTPRNSVEPVETTVPLPSASTIRSGSRVSKKESMRAKGVDDIDTPEPSSAPISTSPNRPFPSSSSPKHKHLESKKPISHSSPSAKSKGKRKASDKDGFNHLPLPLMARTASFDATSLDVDAGTNMDPYLGDLCLNDTVSALGAGVEDTLSDGLSLADDVVTFRQDEIITSMGLSMFEHPTIGPSDIETRPLPTDALVAHANPYLSSPVRSDTVNMVYGDGFINPWLLNKDDHPKPNANEAESTSGYVGNGTIDPSLLGGIVSEPQRTSPSPSPSRSPSPLPSQVQDRSSDDPDFAPSPPRKKRKLPVHSPPLPLVRTATQRTVRAPVKADMIFTEDLDMSSEDSDSHSNFSDSSDEENQSCSARKPLEKMPYGPANTTKRIPPAKASSDAKQPPEAQPHPPPAASEATYSSCHHCRRSTLYDKMQCSSRHCTKRFCIRCISKRYPDITFDRDLTTFVCPACDDNCGCTVCTRKRGEVYIGERATANRHKSPSKNPSKTRIDEDIPRKTVAKAEVRSRPAPASVPVVIHVVPEKAVSRDRRAIMNTFMGTIYGIGGDKLGSGAVANDGKDDFVAARLAKGMIRLVSKAKKKKRVFVGTAQEWWEIRAVREVDPVVVSRCKGKESLVHPTITRTYIGTKPPRRVRPPARHGLSFSRSPSPLTSAPETDEEEGGVRTGQQDTASQVDGVVSLGEADVSRAIVAALSALA